MILDVQGVLVASDIVTEFFCCDLEACRGRCCVEGDAGAPVTLDEVALLEERLDEVWPLMSASAQSVVDRQGVAYVDQEGELVTSIVGGRDCVFVCQDEAGGCWCGLEKANANALFVKPMSCALYPIRARRFGDISALNYHRWDICSAARLRGQQLGVRVYEFLEGPLVRCFGREWYDELTLVANEYLSQYG